MGPCLILTGSGLRLTDGIEEIIISKHYSFIDHPRLSRFQARVPVCGPSQTTAHEDGPRADVFLRVGDQLHKCGAQQQQHFNPASPSTPQQRELQKESRLRDRSHQHRGVS